MNYTFNKLQAIQPFSRKGRIKRAIICLIALMFIAQQAAFCQEWAADLGKDNKISLDVKGMDVVDVLKILSDEGGFNLSISGNVSGRVTLFLKDIKVWDALEIVLISGNLAYERKGEIIYVTTERDYELKYGKKFWDEKKVKVFSFKHAKASRVKELFSQMISNVGKVIVDEPTNTLVVIDIPERISEMGRIVENIDKPMETKVFALNYIKAEDLEPKLADVLTENAGSLKFDQVSNNIIVTDYPGKIKEIEDIVKAFDEKPLQVLIDAKIVELTPSKNFYAGISWDYWIKKYFQTTGTFTLPYTATTDKVSFGTNPDSGVNEVGNYSGIMDFLQMFGETKILSTPRVLVLNNQEAKILVGKKEAYITSTTSSGETPLVSQAVNFVDTGVKLYVTPSVNKKGYVALKIKPEISTAKREKITSENEVTEVPIITTSEAETSLIVKDGVSIFLGGLRKVSRDKQRKQVPILGSIPLLGTLFRSAADEWEKKELVIILTPHIVSGDKPIEMEIHRKLVDQMWEAQALGEFKEEEKAQKDWRSIERRYFDGAEDSVKEAQAFLKGESWQEPVAARSAKMTEKAEEAAKAKQAPKRILEVKPVKEEDYYLKVVEKLKKTTSFYKVSDRGRVKVRFSVSDKGALIGEPQIISHCKSEELKAIAAEIVKQSSPFGPFPASKKDKIETYEVLLVF